MKVAKVNFNDCIGAELFGGGITEQFVRYAVEGPNCFDPALLPVYPEAVELHFFNCPGGEVYEGYGIYAYLRTLSSQGVKVTANIHGLCASIASVIVLAADERLVGPLGQIMVHKPMCDAGPWANADDHAKAALELNKLQTQIAAVYALRTGQPLDVLHSLMNAETFLYPAEALALGFATGLLTEAPPEPAQEVARKVLNYARPHLTPTPANMATLNETEEKGLFAKFRNWLNDEPKNEAPAAAAPAAAPAPTPVVNAATSFPATDDSGAAITLYADGSDLAVDAAVFTDEALSIAAADGNYTLEDGREITILGGTVSEMEATDAAEVAAAALAATNLAAAEALTAEVADLKTQLATATNQVKSLKAKVAKAVPGSSGNPTPAGTQTITNKVAAPTAGPAAFTIRKV